MSAAYTTKRLDHLGLIAGFNQEIGLAAIIDRELGTSERQKISYGQLFEAMILNGLGFTGRTLHMYSCNVPKYLRDISYIQAHDPIGLVSDQAIKILHLV